MTVQADQAAGPAPATPGPVRAPRPPLLRISEKGLYFVAAIFLFVLAIQLMKSGAKALAPNLEGTFPTDNAVSTLGLGWIGAYLVLAGSPVAAVALSLFSADALTNLQTFTMLSGSRLGASFIVLLVGFLYGMRSKNPKESTGMGVLALTLTAVVYLPGMLLGYAILRSGMLASVRWTASAELDGVVDRVWGPLLNIAKDNVPGWVLFPIGLGVILISFKLLDRVLPQLDADRAAHGRLHWLKNPWPMFLLGCLAALLTLSVAVAITVMVPLAAKGYVDRREAMPYIMGANITTLADTLVAAMLLGKAEGVQIVLAEAIAVAAVTIFYLLLFYRPLQRWIMALDEWVVASRRRLVLFVGVLFLVPAILLLSGRIIGVGGLAARNPGQFWLSLLACVMIALPVWGCLDAISRDSAHWAMIGRSKAAWAAGMAIGAPFGVGFLLALVYLIKVRPQLSVAELQSVVAVWGDEAEFAAV